MKRLHLALALLCLACITSNLQSETVEHLSFKGDVLGVSLLSFSKKYYGMVDPRINLHTPYLDFGDFKQGYHSGRSFGAIRAEKLYGLQKGNAQKETIANAPAENVSFTFVASSLEEWDAIAAPARERAAKWTPAKNFEIVMRDWTSKEEQCADHAKLAEIRIDIQQEHFDQVINALSERYGPSTKTEVSVVQNRMGADFNCRVLTWNVGEDIIVAKERTEEVDASVIFFRNPALLALTEKFYSNANKESARDL